MDLKVRCRYIYNKYYKFVLYDLWEWVGKSFSTYEQTYFERYDKLKEVEQQLKDSFEKVRHKFEV